MDFSSCASFIFFRYRSILFFLFLYYSVKFMNSYIFVKTKFRDTCLTKNYIYVYFCRLWLCYLLLHLQKLCKISFRRPKDNILKSFHRKILHITLKVIYQRYFGKVEKYSIWQCIVQWFFFSHNNNKSNRGKSIPVVVGIVYPNGIQVSGYGNMSKLKSVVVEGNIVFDIASISKTFVVVTLNINDKF